MKKNIAIVGSGISAMTTAHYLKDDFNISIFDKNDYLGGHTHTHEIMEGDKKLNIDTGFIVFNEQTYRNMLKMFAELKVEKQKSEMSFSVYNKKTGLQYSGSSFQHLFSQKKNVFSPRHWSFLFEINKFFNFAIKDYKEVEESKETIKDYCERRGLSNYFVDNYLAPMSSAVWSTPQADVNSFPIALLLPFFYNHGLLGLNRQYQWYTVAGGSNTYTKEIVKNGNFDIHLSESVLEAVEKDEEIMLKTSKKDYVFDLVVLASHSDESLQIAKDLSGEKKDILKTFTYNSNIAVLHTDESVMPTIKKTWSSWNHIIEGDEKGTSTVYWMNRLENLESQKNYFVSINPISGIKEDKIIKKLEYMHPNFSVENFLQQKRLHELNENTKIYFAGAYFGYGFHEDGARAGLEVVKKIKNNK